VQTARETDTQTHATEHAIYFAQHSWLSIYKAEIFDVTESFGLSGHSYDDDSHVIHHVIPTEMKLLRSTDLFHHDLKTFLFHSIYGHQDKD